MWYTLPGYIRFGMSVAEKIGIRLPIVRARMSSRLAMDWSPSQPKSTPRRVLAVLGEHALCKGGACFAFGLTDRVDGWRRQAVLSVRLDRLLVGEVARGFVRVRRAFRGGVGPRGRAIAVCACRRTSHRCVGRSVLVEPAWSIPLFTVVPIPSGEVREEWVEGLGDLCGDLAVFDELVQYVSQVRGLLALLSAAREHDRAEEI